MKFKIEFSKNDIWHNIISGRYYDTFEEAKSDFEFLVERAKDSENEMDMFECIYLYEYDTENCGDFDNKKMICCAEKKHNYNLESAKKSCKK